MFSQATTHSVVPADGIHLTVEDIRANLELGEDVHVAPTRLICLENTLSGIVFPQDEAIKISQLAKENDIGMHLDGARLWNAAAKVLDDRGMDATDEEDRRKV